MTVHGVLVQTEQKVQLVAVADDELVANTERQENVTAANYRLVGVVGAEVETTAHDDTGQDVSRGGNALPGLAPDRHRKVIRTQSHRSAPILPSVGTCAPQVDGLLAG